MTDAGARKGWVWTIEHCRACGRTLRWYGPPQEAELLARAWRREHAHARVPA